MERAVEKRLVITSRLLFALGKERGIDNPTKMCKKQRCSTKKTLLHSHNNRLFFAYGELRPITIHSVELHLKPGNQTLVLTLPKRRREIGVGMRQVHRERVVQHVKVRIYASCHRSTATQRADVVHVLNLVASVVDKRFIEQHHALMSLQHHVRLLHVVRPAHHAPQLRTAVENPLGRDEVLPLTPPVFEHVRWHAVFGG